MAKRTHYEHTYPDGTVKKLEYKHGYKRPEQNHTFTSIRLRMCEKYEFLIVRRIKDVMTPYGLMHQVGVSQTNEHGDAICILECQNKRMYFVWDGKLWARARSKKSGMAVMQGAMSHIDRGQEIKVVLYELQTERRIVWPDGWNHEAFGTNG